jgi:hypothetical protein
MHSMRIRASRIASARPKPLGRLSDARGARTHGTRTGAAHCRMSTSRRNRGDPSLPRAAGRTVLHCLHRQDRGVRARRRCGPVGYLARPRIATQCTSYLDGMPDVRRQIDPLWRLQLVGSECDRCTGCVWSSDSAACARPALVERRRRGVDPGPRFTDRRRGDRGLGRRRAGGRIGRDGAAWSLPCGRGAGRRARGIRLAGQHKPLPVRALRYAADDGDCGGSWGGGALSRRRSLPHGETRSGDEDGSYGRDVRAHGRPPADASAQARPARRFMSRAETADRSSPRR